MFENSENRAKLKSLIIFEKVSFEFKDGWTDLVYNLGKDITELCELTNCELPKMLQIKEKMGTLRFYYDDSNLNYPNVIKNSIFALVSRAVGKSANICEECGKYGELRVDSGYWFVSCDEHKRNSISVEEWKELEKNQREFLEEKTINEKPYKPLKFDEIKSPILKRKIMEKVACLEAVCWDYEIKAVDVFNILRTEDDKDYPISFDVLRKKVLKYVSVENLKKVFTEEQLKKLFSDISLRTLRNPETKDFVRDLKKDIVMNKINLYEALLMEQEEKNEFYRDTLYGKLNWFIFETLDKKISKKDYLERLEILIRESQRIYEKLVPKYDRYIENFNLKKIASIKNVRYEDFKLVQNLNNFDLLDYADFIKLGGNTPKRILFNLNTMNPKQIELTMYIRFMNSLLLHTRINYIHDLKSKGFDLFVALNDDIDGLFLQVTTDWYLTFFDEDEFKAKWKAFKKLRIADYRTTNCLSLKEAKVFVEEKFELRERETPLINKDLLFKFKDNKDEKILFQKKWLRGCNSMFWSSPDKMEMPIKNIITIALNNNPSFLTFLDLYLLFGTDLMRYTEKFYSKADNKILPKYLDFFKICFDIFEFSSKNYKDINLKRNPLLEQDFVKLIYSELFNVAFDDANECFPIQLLYCKKKALNNKFIERKIREYIADCLIADLQRIECNKKYNERLSK